VAENTNQGVANVGYAAYLAARLPGLQELLICKFNIALTIQSYGWSVMRTSLEKRQPDVMEDHSYVTIANDFDSILQCLGISAPLILQPFERQRDSIHEQV
jgi:hypothetical protein